MKTEKELQLCATAIQVIFSTRKKLDEILLLKFPSTNSQKLAIFIKKLLGEIKSFLISELDPEIGSGTMNEDALNFLLIFLGHVGSHLRYIEGAASDRNPIPLVRSFEKIAQDLFDDTELIVRPQWSYNYGLVPNIIEYYKREVVNLLDNEAIKRVSDGTPPLPRPRVLLDTR